MNAMIRFECLWGLTPQPREAPGVAWISALLWGRRPERVGPAQDISELSPFDLRLRIIDTRPTEAVRAVIPAEVAATLHGPRPLDTASERLVFRAAVADDGVVLSGDEDGSTN